MRSRRILFVRSAITDVAMHNDHRGAIGGGLEVLIGTLHQFGIVRIGNARDIPAVSHKAGCHVFGKGDICVALDGDAVAVVDPA